MSFSITNSEVHGNKNQTPKNSCNEQCKDFKIVIKGLTKNDKQTFKENAVNEKKHLIAFCIPFNTVHKKIIHTNFILNFFRENR